MPANAQTFARCLGGESAAIDSASSTPKPCNHCVSQSKNCIWPGEDGRKKARTSSPSASDISFRQGVRGKDASIGREPQPSVPEVPGHRSGQPQGMRPPSDHGISPASHPPPLPGNTNGHSSAESSNSSSSETPYTTVHYHRHLGPTAIAP